MLQCWSKKFFFFFFCRIGLWFIIWRMLRERWNKNRQGYFGQQDWCLCTSGPFFRPAHRRRVRTLVLSAFYYIGNLWHAPSATRQQLLASRCRSKKANGNKWEAHLARDACLQLSRCESPRSGSASDLSRLAVDPVRQKYSEKNERWKRKFVMIQRLGHNTGTRAENESDRDGSPWPSRQLFIRQIKIVLFVFLTLRLQRYAKTKSAINL